MIEQPHTLTQGMMDSSIQLLNDAPPAQVAEHASNGSSRADLAESSTPSRKNREIDCGDGEEAEAVHAAALVHDQASP
jgi:hypothetical protein